MEQQLPEDVVEYIISFMFGSCNHCSALYHYRDLTSNYSVIEYKTVFNDDYGFQNFLVFERICNDCKWELGLFMLT